MKKWNNPALLVTFSGLVLIFVLTKVFRSPARESNLDTRVFKVDTARITAIKLYPQKDTLTEITLVRKGNRWQAVRKDVQADVPPSAIRNLLTTLKRMQPERVVTRKPEKWSDYQVNDSAATVVTVWQGGQELLTLNVGKESGNVTYIRTGKGDEVYAADGYLQSVFNTTFNDWRSKSFIRFARSAIETIEFHYPADSSFTLERRNNAWMIGNEKADSASVEAYLARIHHKDLDTFIDRFSPSAEPVVTVTFKSKTAEEVTLKAWQPAFYQWVLHTTLQPDTYFLHTGATPVPEVFAGRKAFTKGAGK
jgi:hypothetical protein